MEKALLEPVVSKILDEMRLRPIPLGVSIDTCTSRCRITNNYSPISR